MSTRVDYLEQLKNAPGAGSGLVFLPATYDFASQMPGGTLTASVPATALLVPVPEGVNGSDVGHYLWISGGTGTAEAVLITGGTAVSGAASGTITFTPANSHSGLWTISSATDGVREAIQATGGYGTVLMPDSIGGAASIVLRGPLVVPPGYFIALYGISRSTCFVNTTFTSGDAISFNGSTGGILELADFSLTATSITSGNAIHLISPGYGVVRNLVVMSGSTAIKVEGNNHTAFDQIWIREFGNSSSMSRGLWVTNASGVQHTGQYSNFRITTTHTLVNGLQVDDPAVGSIFEDFFIEQGLTPNNNDVGLNVVLATGFSAYLQFADFLIDGFGAGVVVTGPAATPSANHAIILNNVKVNSFLGMQIHGQFVANVQLNGCNIVASQGGAAGAPTASDRCVQIESAASNVAIMGGIYDCDGDAVVYLNGVSNIDILGARLGAQQVNGAVSPTVAVSINGTVSGLRVIGNSRLFGSSAPIVNNGTLSGQVDIRANGDLDTTITTIANGATLAMPFAPNFTLTTGTGVTAVTSVFSAGTTWRFTVSSSTTFTAGASIGNTITITKWAQCYWDGTKLWIQGI